MDKIIDMWVRTNAISEMITVGIFVVIFLFFWFREQITDFIFARRKAKKDKAIRDEIVKNIPEGTKSIFDD